MQISNSDSGRRYLSLTELQSLNLKMLKEFDEFCKKSNIIYSLCGGTALGAARHRGFIPWDDDVDVMLLRSDYEHLLSLKPALQRELQNRDLISLKDETFARDYARFIHRGYGRDDDQAIPTDCPHHGIDIFPIDYIPDDEALFQRQVRERTMLKQLLLTCASPFNTGTTFAKKWARNLLRPFANAYGKYRIARRAENVCTRYDKTPGCDIAVVAGEYGIKERWSKDSYFPLVEVPFEDMLCPMPHGYDEYLSAIYGEYMQIPAPEKRKPPHLRVYEIQ